MWQAGTFELKQWLGEHPLVKPAANERHFFGHGEHVGVGGMVAYAQGSPEWRLSKGQINKVSESVYVAIKDATAQ